MTIGNLSQSERDAILQCMKVLAEGKVIEDWEFLTRLGAERPFLEKVISRWPNFDYMAEDSEEFLVINNSLNEICNGLVIPETKWREYFSFSRDEIRKAYAMWSSLTASSGRLP